MTSCATAQEAAEKDAVEAQRRISCTTIQQLYAGFDEAAKAMQGGEAIVTFIITPKVKLPKEPVENP